MLLEAVRRNVTTIVLGFKYEAQFVLDIRYAASF